MTVRSQACLSKIAPILIPDLSIIIPKKEIPLWYGADPVCHHGVDKGCLYWLSSSLCWSSHLQ